MSEEKDKEFSDVTEDLVEFTALPKKPKPKAKLKLSALNSSLRPQGRVICVDEAGNGYLLPLDVAPLSHKDVREFAEDDKDLEPLYNWDKEIEAMLPDRAAMVKAVRLSLYRAGALARGDLAKNLVKRSALKTAFPYVISELEE